MDSKSSNNGVVLGYWDIRGLANAIRLLMEHVGQKYEYRVPESRPSWYKEKHSLGMPFPNLPYLIDGNTKLTQSRAIIKYLARKHGLVAKSEEEIQNQDMVDGLLQDIQNNWSVMMYMSPDFEKAKQQFLSEKTDKFKLLDQWLADKKFLTGDKLNYVDFMFFEQLDGHNAAIPELMGQFPNLQQYHQRMMDQKGVKEFITSDRSPKAFNGPSAKWGAGAA